MGFVTDSLRGKYMLEVLKNIIYGFVSLLKLPLLIMLVSISIFVIMVIYNIIKMRIKGYKLPNQKGYRVRLRKRPCIARVFLDAPRQFVQDLYNRPPGFFMPQGMIIFEGEQGSGKTVAMVHQALKYMKEYPRCKVISNFGFKKEHDTLEHWKKLVYYKNGIYGVIAMMDETQNWFSSNQSQSFPPEMLSVVTQNRKNRRLIMGTAQSFYMLQKNIRTQCTEVRKCITLLGCITIVLRKKPVIDSDGQVVKWKPRGIYFFVHNKEIRESYDTYRIIENLSKSGFKENINVDIVTRNVVNINKKALKK